MTSSQESPRRESDGAAEAAPAPTLRSVLEAFVRGATRPSGGALVGTIGVAATMMAACALFVTPAFLGRIDIGYLMNNRYDSYAHLTGEVFRLELEGVPDDAVLLFGTSAANHGVEVPDLERDLTEATGREATVLPLYADALGLWEMLNAIDEIGESYDGVVVIAASAMAFCQNADNLQAQIDDPRLPFRSEAYAAEARRLGVDLPGETGNYFFDYSNFFTARLRAVGNIFTGPKGYGRLYDERGALPDPGRWDRLMVALTERMDQYDACSDVLFEGLERIVETARSKGDVRVVVVEPPTNPRAVAQLNEGGVFDRHRARMEAFAAEHGIEYWPMDGVELAESDFIDWTHLLESPSRTRYTEALASRLAALMNEGVGR